MMGLVAALWIPKDVSVSGWLSVTVVGIDYELLISKSIINIPRYLLNALRKKINKWSSKNKIYIVHWDVKCSFFVHYFFVHTPSFHTSQSNTSTICHGKGLLLYINIPPSWPCPCCICFLPATIHFQSECICDILIITKFFPSITTRLWEQNTFIHVNHDCYSHWFLWCIII